VCCSSSLSHHAQLAGAVRRGRTTRSISSFCLRVAGGVLGRGNHASAWSDILLWPRPGKVDASTTPGPTRRFVCIG
jgi:hypothetical protein